MTNDEKVKIMKKRGILYYLIIFFGLATLVLALYSLIDGFTPLPAIIAFFIEAMLTKYRESLNPKGVNLDSKNQE